jgi:iron complex outermembrane receptor protein
MKKRTLAPVLLSLLSGPILAQPHSTHLEHHIEEIIVTATPFRDEIAETMLPVNVVTGEELRRKVGHSLGETLKNETGIHSASFGTGVGQPVIRGQSGNRVQVLQSGVEVTDAAAISPDHANGVEPLLADRIEVLRGPSTLLYGNGAIGGVVNVVDRRIPQTLKSEHRFIGEQAYDSVSDENRTLIRFDGAAGSLGFHLDGVTRSGNNVDIPGFANRSVSLKTRSPRVSHCTSAPLLLASRASWAFPSGASPVNMACLPAFIPTIMKRIMRVTKMSTMRTKRMSRSITMTMMKRVTAMPGM